MTTGWIDLHCHWLPNVDDGVTSDAASVELLSRLFRLGFRHVVATPHLRAGMFETTPTLLLDAFTATTRRLDGRQGLPELSLGSEHFLDDVNLDRFKNGQALPYRKANFLDEPRFGGSALIEYVDLPPLQALERQMRLLRDLGYLPVLAHPERYRGTWDHPERLEALRGLGVALLLDVAALVGKYGRHPQKAAREFLELELYDAACTDAHQPEDASWAERGLQFIDERYGGEEVELLFRQGPEALLAGRRLDD